MNSSYKLYKIKNYRLPSLSSKTYSHTQKLPTKPPKINKNSIIQNMQKNFNFNYEKIKNSLESSWIKKDKKKVRD